MLISKSQVHPLSNKTPRGGRIIAKANLKISVQVKAIVVNSDEKS